jgi:hypothetical protein
LKLFFLLLLMLQAPLSSGRESVNRGLNPLV